MGGTIPAIAAAAEGLVKRGHRVTVFTTNANLDEEIDVPLNQPVERDGVEVWYFKRYEPIKRLFFFWPYFSESVGVLYSPRLRDEIKKRVKDFDLVHVHSPFVYPSVIAAKTATKNDIPVFMSFHGSLDPERLRYRGAKKRFYINLVLRRLANRAAGLILLTKNEMAASRLLGFGPSCRIVPNGIMPEDFIANHEIELLNRMGIPEDRMIILFMGRIHPVKGADLLLDAFTMVAEIQKDVMLVLAGPDECGLEKRFKNVVRNRAIEKQVLFPGMVTGKIKKNLLARANLFCLPSTGEGFSIAVLEAMASKTAVMISPGCYFPEVESANAGLVVERDAKKWSESILGLLSDRGKLNSMGKDAYNFVRQQFCLDRVIEQLEACYLESVF